MFSAFRTLLAVLLLWSALPVAAALPDLEFQDLGGQAQKLSDLRGAITVVGFWATWCEPCREELPLLAQLRQRYAAAGVRFVIVSVDAEADRDKIEPLLRAENIDLDVWVGADAHSLDRLGLGHVVPGTLVLDQQGEPVGRVSGQAHDADITRYLDWLLRGRAGNAPPAFLDRRVTVTAASGPPPTGVPVRTLSRP